MLRYFIFALMLLYTINVQASMLFINYYMDNGFPEVIDAGGITNTTDSSIQTNGVLGTESYSAQVSYGSAKASASSSSGAEQVGAANTHAAWEDTLTINAAGFSGFISLSFSLSGSTAASMSEGTSAGAHYEMDIICADDLFYQRSGWSQGGDPLSDFTSTEKGILFGEAFDLRVQLGVYSGSNGDFDSGSSASATDIELILTGITITSTEGGDPIAASIVSGSGTVYPINAIPEPASASLLILSAAVFFIYRRILVS